MKILCLHAMGTSGSILEKQLAPLKHAIGDEHDFVFVDGPFEHDPHSSVKDRIPGPYFCYHETLSAADQAEAHAFILEVIEDEGPFDGVIGFSQGASLAVSYLLQHKVDKPNRPPPFSFAVLFNANLVVSPDQHFCEDEIIKEVTKSQQTRRSKLKLTQQPSKRSLLLDNKAPLTTISKHKLPGRKSDVADEVLGLLNLSISAAESEGWADRTSAFEGKTVEDFPRIIHPLMLDTRIDIPTALIVGQQDPLFLCSLVQKRLCVKSMRNFVVHAEGHDIPRAGAAFDQAVVAIKWAIAKARMATMGGGAF